MRPRMAALWVACLALCACGKFSRLDDGGFTTVNFANGFQNFREDLQTSAVLNGGLMIYAYSENYVTNKMLSTELAAAGSITLPNGAYTFYAVGYPDSSNPLAYTSRCAIAGGNVPIQLNGSQVTVTLNLTSSACTDLAFVGSSSRTFGGTDTNYSSGFARVAFATCGTNATSSVGGFSSTSTCGTGDPNHWDTISTNWFGVGYVVRMPIFRRSSGTYTRMADGLVGVCQSAGAGFPSTSSTTLNQLPFGRSDRPGLFPVEVVTYMNSDCSGSQIASHNFRDGLVFGPSSGSANTNYGVANSVVSSANTAIYFLIGN
jgi:hypothetical protein